MSFSSSLINQLGRDSGKVITNMVFKDLHATPIRVSGGNKSGESSIAKKRTTIKKSEFEKLLHFNMSFTGNTLVRKTVALFSAMENELNKMLSDDYLDIDELKKISEMHIEFLRKCEEVVQALSLTGSKKELIESVLGVAALSNKKFADGLITTNATIRAIIEKLKGEIEHEKPVPIEYFSNTLGMFKKVFKGRHYKKYLKTQAEKMNDLNAKKEYFEKRIQSNRAFVEKISKITFEKP